MGLLLGVTEMWQSAADDFARKHRTYNDSLARCDVNDETGCVDDINFATSVLYHITELLFYVTSVH